MLFATLRMTHLRRLSADPGIKTPFPLKNVRRIAKVIGAVVVGGFIFITNEVAFLNKAVTINTQAVLQEKHKSYIYLNSNWTEQVTISNGLTNRARKELHRVVRRFLDITSKILLRTLDGRLTQQDADSHECSMWALLKTIHSTSKDERHQAVRELAENTHWQDYQYQTIAQALDLRSAVGLARTFQVDRRFFLKSPVPPHVLDGSSLEDSLRQLLASLPQSEVDECVQHFTSLALRECSQALAAQRGGLWCFGGNGLPYAQSLTNIPSEKVESFCLQALVEHSKVPSHCEPIVAQGGLKLLWKIFQLRDDSPKIQKNIIRIIGNLALDSSNHKAIVQAGWLSVLAEMIQSPQILKASHAARALANLDRDAVEESYPDGVYMLHPHYRTSQPVEADVLFVHGLLGAAFKTWRQKDVDPGPKIDTHTLKEPDDYTHCWPKSWLAADCPHLRILSVEYDTHLSDWGARCPAENQRKSLAYRSSELLKKLKDAGIGDRPIVWVAHSMGGLLVKKMLLDASQDPHLHSLLTNTKGILFYSVPHHGTNMAEYSVNVRYLLFPSIEVRELCRDSPSLKELNENFLKIAKDQEFKILSITETLPTVIGPMIKILVVPELSADLGVGEIIQVDMDHLNICKPEKKNSFLYKRSLQFIQDCIGIQVTQ